jgi:hypothetical protein
MFAEPNTAVAIFVCTTLPQPTSRVRFWNSRRKERIERAGIMSHVGGPHPAGHGSGAFQCRRARPTYELGTYQDCRNVSRCLQPCAGPRLASSARGPWLWPTLVPCDCRPLPAPSRRTAPASLLRETSPQCPRSEAKGLRWTRLLHCNLPVHRTNPLLGECCCDLWGPEHEDLTEHRGETGSLGCKLCRLKCAQASGDERDEGDEFYATPLEFESLG